MFLFSRYNYCKDALTPYLKKVGFHPSKVNKKIYYSYAVSSVVDPYHFNVEPDQFDLDPDPTLGRIRPKIEENYFFSSIKNMILPMIFCGYLLAY